jgi:hypothetical protein
MGWNKVRLQVFLAKNKMADQLPLHQCLYQKLPCDNLKAWNRGRWYEAERLNNHFFSRTRKRAAYRYIH